MEDKNRIREMLETKYMELQQELGTTANHKNIAWILKQAISSFTQQCKNPAVWCYGKHTKMLMADFMFELKKVHYIIDNGIEAGRQGGFEIIGESQLEEKDIDGIIISSRIYRKEIAETLREHHEGVKYLDIYEALESKGISLDMNYYHMNHPYSNYCALNKLQRSLEYQTIEDSEETLKKIIRLYVKIKDFRSAIRYGERMKKRGEWGRRVLERLKELYSLQLDSAKTLDEAHVVMLCIDGLRRKEVCKEHMGRLYDFLEKHTCYFDNTYSVSTSTYESLIPAYSENDDLRTRYYEENRIKSGGCRFVNVAKGQGRGIWFYTDGTDYIEDEEIHVTPDSQTCTEKLWDFLLDALNEKNGLFYIHILYESHYSYPNPYTKAELIAEGTNILFDYLEGNGGKIRTDYCGQQRDALRYLDDVLMPFVEQLPCRMVVYADHGNILVDRETELNDIRETKYTFHEDLLQVPLAVKSPEISVRRDHSLLSIMELSAMVVALMRKEPFEGGTKEYVKVVRSQIYNPDFIYLYKMAGHEQGLQAFEVFVFEQYKLAVYSDGTVEVYEKISDQRLYDESLKERLLSKARGDITVCGGELLGLRGQSE